MQIYNTLGREKEEFIPVHPGHANLYVCGITAYDYCHIGHARSAIVFDVLVRQLRYLGLEVCFIRNFTDIDDKIIRRAREEDCDWRQIARKYIDAFHADMERLGVNRADLEPLATDHIQQIIDLCSRLIASGHAYATENGDVYFHVRDYAPYGKLSGRSLDDMRAGARVAPGEQKRDPLDFALWKGAKPGEPAWPSPWGPGRPGWHIECSAMSLPYLPLDIHGGGQDLIFPHHENEIAQSEAVCGCQLARYWLHNGFVRIESEKMSKSAGNFFTIREVLEQFLPETLRYFLLTKHYRSPIDFSFEGMEEAEKAQQRVYACLSDVKATLERGHWGATPLPDNLLEEWQAQELALDSALNDDLNTAQALGHIFAQVNFTRKILEDRKFRATTGARLVYESFVARCQQWKSRLGLFGEDANAFLAALRDMRIDRKKIDVETVKSLMAQRDEARRIKDFSRSDEIRSRLLQMGITIRDSPGGTVWDIA